MHMGRAVLIGLLAQGVSANNDTGLCEDSQRTGQWFVQVSLHIDWIKNITKHQ